MNHEDRKCDSADLLTLSCMYTGVIKGIEPANIRLIYLYYTNIE